MKRLVPDEVVLGLIKYQPSHGYELINWFNSREYLGRIWTMSTSQIYAVLRRLEDQGAIAGREISTPNAPNRNEFHITEKGGGLLQAWLYDSKPSASIHRIRVEFISRLFITELLGLSKEQVIQHQKAACESVLERIKQQKSLTGSPTEELTLNFVIGQLESALNWLADCETYALPMTEDKSLFD
mgnify:CR=1 FL=1